jgi:hypothetical protein
MRWALGKNVRPSLKKTTEAKEDGGRERAWLKW